MIVDLPRAAHYSQSRSLSLTALRTQLRLGCNTELTATFTGCHRIDTTSDPTQPIVTADMTVAEAVKDAVGLGGGGALPTKQDEGTKL